MLLEEPEVHQTETLPNDHNSSRMFNQLSREITVSSRQQRGRVTTVQAIRLEDDLAGKGKIPWCLRFFFNLTDFLPFDSTLSPTLAPTPEPTRRNRG
eukprot:snap_masked-scaffold_12-processed-gene-5.43-mRNA-1 protein AED:1.00 eAED:1.00 QI:0/0/0/0/1/1/2/0/96